MKEKERGVHNQFQKEIKDLNKELSPKKKKKILFYTKCEDNLDPKLIKQQNIQWIRSNYQVCLIRQL